MPAESSGETESSTAGSVAQSRSDERPAPLERALEVMQEQDSDAFRHVDIDFRDVVAAQTAMREHIELAWERRRLPDHRPGRR